MRASFLSDTSTIRAAVEKLFDEKSPVLVEVRFPRMGTSPDWFLCENAAALNAILDRLGSGAEVHLNSVWDLKHPADAVVFRRRKQTGFQPDTETDCAAVRRLFDEKSPILVEAQFPSMGTSPDWFLCGHAAALNAIVDRLGPGVEVHLSSVWDLKDAANAVVFRKSELADAADAPGSLLRDLNCLYPRVTKWSATPPAEKCDKSSLEYVER